MLRTETVVLGAGGLVAQRLHQRLVHHPWFSLTAVAGSARFAGRPLNEVPWILEEARPPMPNITVEDIEDSGLIESLLQRGVRIAFSALPSEEARRLEPRFAAHGIAVFSNASAFRRGAGVPLVVPELNPEALVQASKKPLVHACATNCTLLPLVLPLAAINERFGVQQYTMRSEQGLSGGGQHYLEAALSAKMVDPAIPGEAEKTDAELRQVLGWEGESEVRCARVLRRDGHHVFVTVQTRDPVTLDALLDSLRTWKGNERCASLPSAPHKPLMLVDQIDPETHLFADGLGFTGRPDPSTDLKAGMAVAVGSVACPSSHTIRFEAYSHNSLRGAAGGLVYLAELAVSMDVLGL